jgi:hypothetical protein
MSQPVPRGCKGRTPVWVCWDLDNGHEPEVRAYLWMFPTREAARKEWRFHKLNQPELTRLSYPVKTWVIAGPLFDADIRLRPRYFNIREIEWRLHPKFSHPNYPNWHPRPEALPDLSKIRKVK